MNSRSILERKLDSPGQVRMILLSLTLGMTFTQVPWMYDEEFEKNINIFYDENIEQLGLVRAQQIYTEG